MTNKVAPFILTLIFAFIGCSRVEERDQCFLDTVSANAEMFIEGEKLASPGLLIVMDNFLVIGNSKNSITPLIEVYNRATGNLQNTFLNLGNGPNEVLMIGNIQYIPEIEELLVADLFKRKIFSYTLDDIIKGDRPEPTLRYKRDDKSPLMFDKLYKDKDFLIAESRDPKGRILLFNEDGSGVGYYLTYPDKENVDNRLSDINNAELYASAMTVSPSLDKIALATYSAGMIDICKVEKNHIEPMWNYTEFYPQGMMVVPMGDGMVVAHTKESRSGFTSISSSDKYIYALYSGKLLEDPTYSYGEVVYVASWDGNETYKINLDKSINRLAVDEKDEYIYGITPEMDIVRFPVPKR